MPPSLKLIVRVRDAETALRCQVEQLLDILPELTERFQVILVDDGSSDHTPELARELAREYPQVVVRADGAQADWADDIVIRTTAPPWLDFAGITRIWQESGRSKQLVPSLPAELPGLPDGLLERLSRWGEQIEPAAAPSKFVPTSRRPASFVCHLREVTAGN